MRIHTFSKIASRRGIFVSWALIVCENMQYVLFGNNKSTGTCFTPNITDASDISSCITAPAFT